MKILFLGDVHTDWQWAENIIQKEAPDAVVQVGDLGWGFLGSRPWKPKFECPLYWVDGNHDRHDLRDDNLIQCSSPLIYCPRGTSCIIRDHVFLFCGGASSIDKVDRVPGLDWWSGESITRKDYAKTVAEIFDGDKYIEVDFLITHEKATDYDLSIKPSYNIGHQDREYIQKIVDFVKPKYHLFGHWHLTEYGRYKNTQWICLGGNLCGINYAIFNGNQMEIFR